MKIWVPIIYFSTLPIYLPSRQIMSLHSEMKKKALISKIFWAYSLSRHAKAQCSIRSTTRQHVIPIWLLQTDDRRRKNVTINMTSPKFVVPSYLHSQSFFWAQVYNMNYAPSLWFIPWPIWKYFWVRLKQLGSLFYLFDFLCQMMYIAFIIYILRIYRFRLAHTHITIGIFLFYCLLCQGIVTQGNFSFWLRT